MVSATRIKQERPVPDQDFHGLPKLTEKFVKDLLKYKKFPDHPMFVTELALETIGFAHIRFLDEYKEVLIMNMMRNNIVTVENIGHMTKLRTL